MRQGLSPRRLALTLALGCAIGCIPLVGIPTALCAALAVALRLNLPAIQAANYLVMPLQIALVWPLARIGAWILPSSLHYGTAPVHFHGSLLGMASQLGAFAGEALLGWLLMAIPAVIGLTLILTPLLRRIPMPAAAESGD